MGKSGPEFATLEGERVADEHGLASLPVDPFELARRANLKVVAKDEPGASGMLVRVGDDFTIVYATHLSNEGFERFSISHELGHFFLRGHPEKVFDANGVHRSNAGFVSKDSYEIEADQFAAGLLMPRKLFRSAASNAGNGFAAIEDLAARCKTSLTATAIRLVELTDEPLAVVLSNQDRVLFWKASRRFLEYRNLTWLERDALIPRGTVTARFVADPRRVVDADRLDDVIDISNWFGTGTGVRLVEEVVGLGRYGKVLTVLSPEDAVDTDEEDEEGELVESWTPRFRR